MSRSAHALSSSHNSGWVFAHVQGLEVCTGLTELNASHNALIDVASSIGSLSELVELNVSHNAIKSWTGFPALKSLMVCPYVCPYSAAIFLVCRSRTLTFHVSMSRRFCTLRTINYPPLSVFRRFRRSPNCTRRRIKSNSHRWPRRSPRMRRTSRFECACAC